MAPQTTHEPEGIEKRLSPRQELFCELYAFDKECFGSATRAYLRAYLLKEGNRNVAASAGTRLLRNVHVKAYISKLLDKHFTDTVVDRRHSQLMHQNKNLLVSLGAIQEYNKVKKRIEAVSTGPVIYMWRGDNRKKPDQTNLPTTTRKTPEARTKKGKFTIKSSS